MKNAQERHDHFFREAQRQGYLARSAFKLLEIQKKFRIIKKGHHVLDLGCAPGAWLQVACQSIGPASTGGIIVGVDLTPVDKPQKYCQNSTIITMQADAFDLTQNQIEEAVGQDQMIFDVILSDMMAATTGHAATDHLQSIALAERVNQLLPDLLKPNGHLIIKVFEGERYQDYVKDCCKIFKTVKGYKPEASRNRSREMYIIAREYKSS